MTNGRRPLAVRLDTFARRRSHRPRRLSYLCASVVRTWRPEYRTGRDRSAPARTGGTTDTHRCTQITRGRPRPTEGLHARSARGIKNGTPRPATAEVPQPFHQDLADMPKVLISDKLSPAAVAIFRRRGIDVDLKTGL